MNNKVSKIILLIPVMFALSACQDTNQVVPEGNHEHTFSTEWSYDESSHWHDTTCGHEIIANKENHSYNDEWVIVKDCTATTDGLKYQECSVCGYHNEVIIEKGSEVHVHTYDSEWHYDDTYHWHESTCGHQVIGNKSTHTYGAWEIVTNPTVTSEGLKRRECSSCGFIEEEKIPVISSDDTPLSLYKITYLKDDIVSQAAASELYDALGNKILGLEEINNFNNDSYSIHLVNDSSLQDKYKLKIDNNALVMASDTTLGLIEGSKDLIEKVSASDKISSYYPNEVTSSYVKKEKIKAMTYNVRNANDGTLGNGDLGDVVNRLPRVAVNIRAFMPDTVAVQEATDIWVSGLKEELAPDYSYLGFGRENNYKGESSGIFYRRDTVTLLESATKWLSDTPDVAGSHFSDYGGYNRIMTYGIFKRNSDGYIYMHVSTHLDLDAVPNAKDARKIDEIISPYKDKMPIIVSGDFNCQETETDKAYYILTDELGYIDSKYQALDNNKEQHTYAQDGYKVGGDPKQIIDFILSANSGLYFDKYLVDTSPYQGPSDTRAQLTSDHYALYTEATPYEPLIPFNNNDIHSSIEIDNGFALYDKSHNLLNHESSFNNVTTSYAYLTDYNGDITWNNSSYPCTKNFTTGQALNYVFNATESGNGDLSISMANKLLTAAGTTDLSTYIDVTLNNNPIDVSGLKLRCSDIRSTLYEWENLVLRGVNINEGVNTLSIISKNDNAPYQLSLDIFSNLDIEPYQIDELSKYKIDLGEEELSLKEFKERYPNIEPTIMTENSESVLTLSLAENSVTTFALSSSLDLSFYDKVYIEGNGELIVNYDKEFDGIVANNLIVEEGTTLSLSGCDSTKMSGIKVHGTLQIDGTVNVTNYGNAIAIDYTESPSVITNVGTNGCLNITNCKDGIHAWHAPTGSSINIEGKLDINANEDAIEIACILPINFNDGSNTSISAKKSGIYYTNNSDQDVVTLSGNANVTMNISTGSGILFASQGKLYLRNSSSLEITANSSGIYGFNVLFVCEGGNDDHSKNAASLKIHSAGSSNGTKAIGADGRTPDGNPIQGRAGHTYFLFDTTGEVLIEGVAGKTGIHLGGSSGSKAYFQVYASDMTIKDCDYAMGCWVNRNWTVNYDYESSGCGKVNITNCGNIYGGNSSPISTKFTNDTCIIS